MEILTSARNELYLNFPYLDVALCGLVFRPGGEVTGSLAADRESLYWLDTSWFVENFGAMLISGIIRNCCLTIHAVVSGKKFSGKRTAENRHRILPGMESENVRGKS